MENSALLLHLPWEVSLRLLLGSSPPPNVSPAPTSSPVHGQQRGFQAGRDPSPFCLHQGDGCEKRSTSTDRGPHAASHQGLLASALLICGAGDLFVVGSPLRCVVFSNIPDLCSLDTCSMSPPPQKKKKKK